MSSEIKISVPRIPAISFSLLNIFVFILFEFGISFIFQNRKIRKHTQFLF